MKNTWVSLGSSLLLGMGALVAVGCKPVEKEATRGGGTPPAVLQDDAGPPPEEGATPGVPDPKEIPGVPDPSEIEQAQE